jgi:hypothetical protein
MELNRQPVAPTYFVTGQLFVEGQRVASFLVRDPKTLAILRNDLLESPERQRGSIGRVLDLELGLFAFDGRACELGHLVRKPCRLDFPRRGTGRCL